MGVGVAAGVTPGAAFSCVANLLLTIVTVKTAEERRKRKPAIISKFLEEKCNGFLTWPEMFFFGGCNEGGKETENSSI